MSFKDNGRRRNIYILNMTPLAVLVWILVLNSSNAKEQTTSKIKPTEINYDVPLTKTDLEWLGSLLELPKDGEIRIRKEYRQMTDEERETFHDAINSLKKDKSVSLNQFDLLGNVHARSSTATAAHNGPGFLGWHRIFLLMMENALRQKKPNVTIPYWDTTLDDGMSQPYYSVVWSENFMGTGGGIVKKGPFKNWITPHGLGRLRRMIYAQGKLMNPKDIRKILKKKYLNDISFPNANLKSNIEDIHNKAHQWVGGQMRKIEHSAYDPSFYILHSFVDLLWEEFRDLQKQNGVDPNIDYPEDYGIANHSPLAPMGLGKLVVIDGLNDIWMKGIQYTARPQCNASNQDCGSKYLKCNKKRSRCISYTHQEYIEKSKVSSASKMATNSSSTNSSKNFSNIDSTTSLNLINISETESTDILKSSWTRESNHLSNLNQNILTTLHSNSAETTTVLPSVFELFGLRWWLFKRDEDSFSLDPTQLWQMLHLKSKSPLSNFLNIFKKPKEDKKLLTSITTPKSKWKDSNSETHTNYLNSSAIRSAIQSVSLILFTSSLLFFNWL